MSTKKNTPDWHVLGVGAIGGLFAARLAQQGKRCQLILKDQQTERHYLQRGAITMQRGEDATDHTLACTTPETLQASLKQLLITTKTYQTLPALQTIGHAIDNHTTLVLLQNGMGIADEIAKYFPQAILLLGTTTDGAYRKTPWHIVHAGRGQTTIGPWLATTEKPAALLADLDAEWESNIQQRLWLKLVMNCAINPLSAIYRCRTGELLDKPEAMQTCKAICEEAAQVGEALGFSGSGEQLFKAVVQLMQKTAANRTSMLVDIDNQRPTEIDAITGYLCQQSTATGIACPVNRNIYQQIKRLSEAGCSG